MKLGSQSIKFDGLRGLGMIDAQKEIAEKFAAIVKKQVDDVLEIIERLREMNK